MFLTRVRSWRRSRPFWGGLFIVAAGTELLSVSLTVNALPVAVMFGAVGAGYLIALIMMIAGLLVWLQPGQRVFLGLVAVVLSMASFVYSNLGGFLLGMVLGLLGGVLAMAWTSNATTAPQAPRWAAATRLGTTIRQASVTISVSSAVSRAASRTRTQLKRSSDGRGMRKRSGSEATSAARSSLGKAKPMRVSSRDSER